jgi:hypothetical protein
MTSSRLALLLAALPRLAAAQTDPADLRLSGKYANIHETMVNDPVLNLAACVAESAASITIDFSYTGTALFDDEVDLEVWFETSSDTECDGDIPGDGADLYLGGLSLAANHDFFDAGEVLRIPDDLELRAGAALTDKAVLDLRGACPNGGGTEKDETITLCIGLDVNKDGNIDSASEPHGWARFDIDTEIPPKPDTPTVQPLDGRVRVTAAVSASGATDDIIEYRGFMRPQPADPSERGKDCEWNAMSDLPNASVSVAGGGGSASMEIHGTNGVTYEICVFAFDDLGNNSPPSDLAVATPREECDFIECYPEGYLESGCRAAGATPLAGVGLLLLALRRARERGV